MKKLWDIDILKKQINNCLPGDIALTECSLADPRFHARLNAKAKAYTYRLATDKPDVFTRRIVYTTGKLDVEKMKYAATMLVGEKDFRGFSSDKRKKKSTVRVLYNIDIRENNGIVEITYMGNGFLYNMVRILTGTLVEIGLGERDTDTINLVFEKKGTLSFGKNYAAFGAYVGKGVL